MIYKFVILNCTIIFRSCQVSLALKKLESGNFLMCGVAHVTVIYIFILPDVCLNSKLTNAVVYPKLVKR